MKQFRFLNGGYEIQASGIVLKETVNLILQRHQPPRASLEMHVVRCGCPALRAVVEDSEIREMPGNISHVHDPVPYCLGDVGVPRNHQMRREYRIWIHENVVFPPLPALELHRALLRRTVLGAEKTFSGLDRGAVHPGCGGTDPLRIVLAPDFQPADLHLPDFRILE